jgi:hypothetical protein
MQSEKLYSTLRLWLDVVDDCHAEVAVELLVAATGYGSAGRDCIGDALGYRLAKNKSRQGRQSPNGKRVSHDAGVGMLRRKDTLLEGVGISNNVWMQNN